MRNLVITLVAITAMLVGFYLSARHFSEPVGTPAVTPVVNSNTDLLGSFRPDFQLSRNSGGSLSPADLSGKTILINFWATWCGPCRKEMPMLVDLQRTHESAGLQVIGIALDDANSVSKFVETFGISYPILTGSEDVFETSAAYGNAEGVLPYSVLIDKSGTVRWQYSGIIEHEQIARLLSEWL
jgi:thiol-disulfide isomerase/thioredoxin